MTTAHRATWYTARGHEEQGGARVFAPSKMRSKLDAPGMLTMKTRWKTKEEEEMESLMNNNKDEKMTTMRMKLLEKERAHFRKKKMERQIMGSEKEEEEEGEDRGNNNSLRIEAGTTRSAFQANPDDADDDDSENEGDNSDDGEKNSDDEENESDSDDDESDSDDDAAALMEELERIKAQRALENERKEREREHLEEMEQRDELKMGNPLLRDEMADANDGGVGKKKSATLKRRWDDDTVFRNQARDEPKREKRFVNDTIRSDFHKRFLNRYIK